MKNVYVKPEVEYINFYSEETITNDSWNYYDESGKDSENPEFSTPTISIVGGDNSWT
jgi:hypothetical protein